VNVRDTYTKKHILVVLSIFTLNHSVLMICVRNG